MPIYMPSNSTVTTSKGDTTEHTENEGLGVNICCSRASAPCRTGNKDGKSWNSPISTSIREKFSRANRSLSNALTSRSSKKTAGNKPKEDGILEYDSPCDDGDSPSLELEADFHLRRGSRLPRCICFNSRIVFNEVFFISLLMKL